MKKILIRSLSGAVYVLIVIGTIFAGQWTGNDILGKIIFSSVFFLIGIIGIYEYINNLAKKGIECNRPMTYIAGTTLYLSSVMILLSTRNIFDTNGRALLYISVTLGILVPVIFLATLAIQLWRNDAEPFTVAGHTFLPSIWIMTPLALANTIQNIGSGIMIMLFIMIWVNDTFAYLGGMMLGRHKMWERHSPNKTWEGTISGALFCVATAILVGPHFYPHIHILGWAISGLICSVTGTLGDLVESMFKRYCGVKDSGNIMPGHGGVLDRFDSLLMAVPFVLLFITIILL